MKLFLVSFFAYALAYSPIQAWGDSSRLSRIFEGFYSLESASKAANCPKSLFVEMISGNQLRLFSADEIQRSAFLSDVSCGWFLQAKVENLSGMVISLQNSVVYSYPNRTEVLSTGSHFEDEFLRLVQYRDSLEISTGTFKALGDRLVELHPARTCIYKNAPNSL